MQIAINIQIFSLHTYKLKSTIFATQEVKL